MAESKKNNILDIVQGIQQAVSNAYDGGAEVGLKREKKESGEKANFTLDTRVMDGFGVAFHGDLLKISYHGEIKLKDVYEKKIEQEIEQMIEDIASYLKKEYKAITGSSLTLAKTKEPVKVLIQSVSHVRTWVQAHKFYKIGGVDLNSTEDKDMDRVEKNFKSWLKSQELEAKRPSNEYIKKGDNEKKEKKESK